MILYYVINSYISREVLNSSIWNLNKILFKINYFSK